MLHPETVEPSTLALLKRLQALDFLRGTRLVGGTALAMQFGHRKSVDLDLFGAWDPPDGLQGALDGVGTVVREGGQSRMQFYRIDGVKTDFVRYEFPWIDPPVVEGGVRLAGVRDIAAMKLFAITNRGAKKDFADLFFLLRLFPLEDMFGFFARKFGPGREGLVLRSLAYFDDAEEDFDPAMIEPFDWEHAKETIRTAVREYASSRP